MFIDDMGVQRFDVLKYKQFDKLTEKQLGFHFLETLKKLIFNKDAKRL